MFSNFGLCFITGCFSPWLRGSIERRLVLGLSFGWRPPFPLFCWFLGCLAVLAPPGWGCNVVGIGAAGWGGKGMGAMPAPGVVGKWSVSLVLPWEPGPPLAGASSCWDTQMWELQVWGITRSSRCGTSLAFGAIAAYVSPLRLALMAVGAEPGPPDFGALKPQLRISGMRGGVGWLYAGLK